MFFGPPSSIEDILKDIEYNIEDVQYFINSVRFEKIGYEHEIAELIMGPAKFECPDTISALDKLSKECSRHIKSLIVERDLLCGIRTEADLIKSGVYSDYATDVFNGTKKVNGSCDRINKETEKFTDNQKINMKKYVDLIRGEK